MRCGFRFEPACIWLEVAVLCDDFLAFGRLKDRAKCIFGSVARRLLCPNSARMHTFVHFSAFLRPENVFESERMYAFMDTSPFLSTETV